MSNASQALIMAEGILLGVFILALIVTLFASSSSLTTKYDEAKQLEAVQQYNSIFTKYLGNDLTIHEAMTIYHLAIDKEIAVTYNNGPADNFPGLRDTVDKYTTSTNDSIAEDGRDNNVQKFGISVEFNLDGYINKINIYSK